MDFRSPGARPSPRIPKHQIPEGPIQEFTHVIESSVPEDWQNRTSALKRLVSFIPNESHGSNHDDWYTSPPTMRHLAIPLSELLTDARSSVVKRTCECLDELFSRCRSDARYLLKDMMPIVCQVHASTVQVIRNYVQTMILDTIPKVPCKMVMPIWLDRLKHDKSKTVREACSLYLYSAMSCWGAPDDSDFESDNSGYLSKQIYHQVGVMLVRTLADASPIVRQNCKKGLEVLTSQRRDVLDELVEDRSLTRDLRARKLLKRLQAGETGVGDDVSVASKMSTRSRGGVSIASAPVVRSRSNTHVSTRKAIPPRGGRRPLGVGSPPPRIPTTIGVASPHSPPRSKFKGLAGPPRRMVNGISSSSTTAQSRKTKPASPPTPQSVPISPTGIAFSTPTQQLLGTSADSNNDHKTTTPATPLEYEIERQQGDEFDLSPNKSFDSNDSVLKPIANAEELRQKAKSRTMLGANSSRRSSLLQDRLLRSASKIKTMAAASEEDEECDDEDETNRLTNGAAASHNGALTDVAHLNENEFSNHPHLPIHTKIAYELLEAHKLHVDQVMETLKVEMDALKDFEMILLEQGPLRPTEEEVVEYFESLGLCLEQRRKAGMILQKRMDRISQG